MGFALSNANRLKTLIVYAAMVAVTVVAFLGIQRRGATLSAPSGGPAAVGGAAVAQSCDALVHVLLALVVISALARLVGALLRYLQQPAVIGEILGGIMLGPSLLGHFAPSAYHHLLPPSVAPYLSIISQV